MANHLPTGRGDGLAPDTEPASDDIWASVPDTPSGRTFFSFALVTEERPVLIRFEEEARRKTTRSEYGIWEARVYYRPAGPGDGPSPWTEALLCPNRSQAAPFKPHRPLAGKTFLLERRGAALMASLAKESSTPEADARKTRAPATATLKVAESTKQELDRLQASLTLELERKPSLQDLLDELVQLGRIHREQLAQALGSTWRPATKEEIDALFEHIRELSRQPPTGPPMSEEDREIYEEDWKK